MVRKFYSTTIFLRIWELPSVYAFLSSTLNYKITKIVRALWLAERSVCVRVCKPIVVASRCFAFRALITQARIWKKKIIYHCFVGSNLENRYKDSVSIFFRLSWHFKRETSVFWKACFCKTRTDNVDKTLRLVRISLLISAIQRVLHFVLGKLFLKAIENVFPVFA